MMNKTLLLFLFVVSVSLSSFTTAHKFYVSVTQVDYNAKQQSLQIVSRVFVDDIEELLKVRYDESTNLDKDEESLRVDKNLATYLGQKLQFVVNGEEVSFTFLGKEYEDDLIICYLEIENITSLNTIEITNQVLMDLFEEQQNIVHVKKGNQRKSLILEKEKALGMLKFSE
ncbi:hypothetical protein IWQ47_000750 [Aquimarina sp. EL_43]|uniref:DUF6702 family protein n=2 Tax=Flavobacteriaceae TaxID=49546 RepID=UPI001A1D0069|nr:MULTISPECIES: DUF6702 family protein [Aquimarina]MBG6128560.1 hypothetical protein [Aquimarina sp. EL_35]MBG6149623.1 hypothetical protein [Aquimarina sp. EL_32]MBG6167692.1 hypothetical protein [Aquimarina sp. EL_43]